MSLKKRLTGLKEDQTAQNYWIGLRVKYQSVHFTARQVPSPGWRHSAYSQYKPPATGTSRRLDKNIAVLLLADSKFGFLIYSSCTYCGVRKGTCFTAQAQWNRSVLFFHISFSSRSSGASFVIAASHSSSISVFECSCKHRTRQTCQYDFS